MAEREYTAKDAQPIVNYGHDGTGLKRFHTNSSGDLYVVPLSLVPTEYDSKEYGYTGIDLTSIVYKLGATTVMTKTIVYDADHNITSITIT